MKKLSHFIAIYIIFIGSFFAIYSSTTSTYKDELKTTSSQLEGLAYLQKISSLTMCVIRYMNGISYEIKKDELKHIYKDTSTCIEKISLDQSKNSSFVNHELNRQLKKIKGFEVTEDGYYKFLNTINNENYIIGDKSKLLFARDRELFFLGSLLTHYMPEYIISNLINNLIIQEFNYIGTINEKKKNIFIEQTKLSFLSDEEIQNIIKILNRYKDTKQLEIKMSKIHNTLYAMKKYISTIQAWSSNSIETSLYLELSTELIEVSFSLNDELHKITENILKHKKDKLIKNLFITNIIFFFIIIITSLLLYLFYKSTMLHIKKDEEIKSISNELDNLAVFSRTDIDGNITYVSSALAEISGYTKEELLGQNHRVLKHEDMPKELFEELWSTILDKRVFCGELLNNPKDGLAYWTRVTITPELNEQGDIISFGAYRVNITDQKALQEKQNELLEANKKLEELTITDPLTQIYNRNRLDFVMDERFESYRRYAKVFSLLIIDIDHFKDVNDTYGHLVGDETLKSVTDIIKQSIRETDTFGRWGGEEFMVICEETSCLGAYNLAEKIRVCIEKYEFTSIDKITVSIGIAEIDSSLSVNGLIKRSDDALYYAKEHGRNRTIKYSEIG